MSLRTVPLRFDTLEQEFPSNGLLLLTTGPGGPRIQVMALSATLISLALDLDSNGAFEIVARLNWADLTGPVGANLADSDGDGMHDGWEAAFGVMDPAGDPDGDGFSNLAEYQGGTNPNVADATPPPPPPAAAARAGDRGNYRGCQQQRSRLRRRHEQDLCVGTGQPRKSRQRCAY